MLDIEYKKALLAGLSANPEDYYRLDSIVGKQELLNFLQIHQESPETYGQTQNFTNVRNKDFQANFHIHTTNSDGLMTVEKLLDMGSRYGNSLAKKHPDKKFYLAITDHNTTEGTIEALKLILENPERYKNLKIVLGIEASAMFTSPNTNTTSEVHLLSYALNPFTDTIAKKNKRRLQIFQYNIKNALNNANIQYIDTINKYGFEFSFDDMSKIRPSIKTCPSNVRYSLKDYLQFRLLYEALIENNQQMIQVFKNTHINKDYLDFSIPKNMITENKYSSYWLNYVEKLQIYLQHQLPAHNLMPDLRTFVNDDLVNTLNSIESAALDPNSNMYIREPAPLSFDEVISSFNNSQSAVSGIAHGALYAQNTPHRKLFLQDLYRLFKAQINQDTVIGEMHYPYKPEIDTQTAQGFIKLYNYLPSGGLDSHKNNFFTPQKTLETAEIESLINANDNYPSDLLHGHHILSR